MALLWEVWSQLPGVGLPWLSRHRAGFRIGSQTPCSSPQTPFLFTAPWNWCSPSPIAIPDLPLQPSLPWFSNSCPSCFQVPLKEPLDWSLGVQLQFQLCWQPLCSLLHALPQFLYLQSEINDGYSMHREKIVPVKPPWASSNKASLKFTS